jgi:hypothetical protein
MTKCTPGFNEYFAMLEGIEMQSENRLTTSDNMFDDFDFRVGRMTYMYIVMSDEI